jgi:hypothetical protein
MLPFLQSPKRPAVGPFGRADPPRRGYRTVNLRRVWARGTACETGDCDGPRMGVRDQDGDERLAEDGVRNQAP